MKLITILLIMWFGLLSFSAQAQISEDSRPISLSLEMPTYEIPTIAMPIIDVDSVIKAESLIEEPKPFRFGYALDVDIDLKKTGLLRRLPNGDKLWLLKIHSQNAFSINLIYNRFMLSKGSKFFVYNDDKSMILGAFTPETSNNQYNEFATDLVQGNTIVLEYYEPEYSNDGVINVSKVIHGYINTFSGGYGNAGACQIDVNCPLGDNWENEKRAVSMILANDDNSAFCTGCLVNNTNEDFTPYYLTANHCFNGSARTNIFRFKYWKPNCNSGNPTNWKSVVGATIRAYHFSSDFMLLELNSTPPADYNVFYAGWDRTATPAQNATSIHHPRGDVMKISYDQHSVTPTALGGPSTYWLTVFDAGSAEPGSSGAPLFNQNHKVVGQLYGCWSYNSAKSFCEQPWEGYGRFDYSWEGNGTKNTRLKDWLDPTNTGATTLEGVNSCLFITLTGNQPTSPDTYKRVVCKTITIDNATVPSGTTLKVKATRGSVSIDNFTIESGAQFVVE